MPGQSIYISGGSGGGSGDMLGANNLSDVDDLSTAAGNLAPHFYDGTFKISDTDAITKSIDFDLSGITAGQTRTLTPPDFDFSIGDYEQNQTVGAHTASYTLSSLSATGHYIIYFRIIVETASATPVYTWRPANVTANQKSVRRWSDGAGGEAEDSNTLVWITTSRKSCVLYGRTEYHADSSLGTRTFITTGGYDDEDDADEEDMGHFKTFSAWEDGSTALTSMVCVCDQANGIQSGSRFWVKRVG